MKIGPVFAPIFEHHQKLVFDTERVGLATGRLVLAFGVDSTTAIASNGFL